MKDGLKHFYRSTAVTLVSTAAVVGFVGFARITAEIDPGFGPLQYSSIITGTAIASYIGYGAFQLLKQYTERPYELFMYLSGFVLIFSYMPIGHLALDMKGAGMPEINVLGTLHVIAAVFIISGIAKLEMMNRN